MLLPRHLLACAAILFCSSQAQAASSDEYLQRLKEHPQVVSILAESNKFGEMAKGEVGLPDPMLIMGVDNLPVNDPAFNRFLPSSKALGFNQQKPSYNLRMANSEPQKGMSAKQKLLAAYTCPMHPHYIAAEPGTCPICGMDLVPARGESEQNSSMNTTPSAGKDEILYWQAPMDPNYKSDKPGKSPMGMDLVPVYGNKSEKGRAAVTISPEVIQSIGIRTEKAEAAMFGTPIRSYGIIVANDRNRHKVMSRVEGWIKHLSISALGDQVDIGDELYKIHSPDLIIAQHDYLRYLKTNGYNNSKLFSHYDLGDKFLGILRLKKEIIKNVPYYSQYSGTISKLNVQTGSYVNLSTEIAEIQDYSSVWVNVSVAEKDLGFLSKDMKAEVTFPNLSNEIRTARIDYIYPTIDKASRTGQVRLVLDNEDGVLRPGAYADVSFDTVSVKRLAIPSEAVLRASDGSYVVVALGDGRFQSRKVKTGIYNKGRVQILSGLNVGDNIVVSSQFMIDSESALRESFRKMEKMQTALSLLDVDKNQMAMIDHLVDASIYLQKSLVGEEEFKAEMLMPALKLNDHLMPGLRGTKLQPVLEGAEKAIMEAQEGITDGELKNALANLMRALKPWLLEGKPQYYKEKDLKLFMDHGTGNLWIQLEDKPANPYGDGMVMPQEWPDKIDAKMPDVQAAPAGDAHAGH